VRGETLRGVIAQRGLLETVRTQQQRSERGTAASIRAQQATVSSLQLREAVETAKADGCRGPCRGNRRILRQRVHIEARAEAGRTRLLAILGGRRRDGVADEQVHVRQASQAEPVAPARLQRREARGECAQATAGRGPQRSNSTLTRLRATLRGEALVIHFTDVARQRPARETPTPCLAVHDREQHDANATLRQRAQALATRGARDGPAPPKRGE
ncbi:MAG: hypothetical protein IPF57_25535, partial [Gammaproteobacteria bacterium]|nr:hypothetical protein [Gammaproteobacteria bacterium]